LLVQNQVDPEYKKIVKAADLLSAYLKACDELRFGNHEFSPVKGRLEGMLQHFSEDMPEVQYFRDCFEENCSVGVDELAKHPI
jgi:5'-deoxynucleotidase